MRKYTRESLMARPELRNELFDRLDVNAQQFGRMIGRSGTAVRKNLDQNRGGKTREEVVDGLLRLWAETDQPEPQSDAVADRLAQLEQEVAQLRKEQSGPFTGTQVVVPSAQQITSTLFGLIQIIRVASEDVPLMTKVADFANEVGDPLSIIKRGKQTPQWYWDQALEQMGKVAIKLVDRGAIEDRRPEEL